MASKPQTLKDIMKLHRGFRKSVQLDLDFQDKTSCRDFVVTEFIEDTFERFSSAFASNSSQRAWRLTGDYGSGKSAFALCMLKSACGKASEVPKSLRLKPTAKLTPVIVVGDRISIISSIGRAIVTQVEGFKDRPIPKNNDELLSLVEDAMAQTGGIFMVLDELGKNLEYAIANPDSADVYTLQRLAELSDRSGNTPFVLLAVLHMGLSAYMLELDAKSRKEWEKVSGRFCEIHYHHPFEQTVQLSAKALGVDAQKLPAKFEKEARSSMKWCVEQGYFGNATTEILCNQAPSIFPLHPTVLAPLVSLFRRFGQNERSLFNFLTGTEPYALQEAAASSLSDIQFYDMSNLYSYIKSAMAPGFINGNAAHWRVIESVITRAEDNREEAILKTVGVLNLLNEDRLIATRDLIVRSVSANLSREETAPKEIESVFDELQRKHLLFKRGTNSGFALWPHTSVHLDDEFERSRKELGEPNEPMLTVSAMLDPVQVVARRHYIETGNLRHFELQFHPAHEAELLASKGTQSHLGESDGHLIILLPKSKREFKDTQQGLADLSKALPKNTLVSVVSPPTEILRLSLDLQAWRHVAKTVTDLAYDDYARAELNRQIRAVELKLESTINNFVGLDGRPNQLAWYQNGDPFEYGSKDPLSAVLSRLCDRLYNKCPRILNELINRRVSSSAGSRARSALAGRIAEFAAKPLLGMDPRKSPPEMSIYLSVLKAGNLHVEDATPGNWKIQFPENGYGQNDPCRLLPCKRLIDDLLTKDSGARVKVDLIVQKLKEPNIGAREGVIPLILSIYLAATSTTTAIYEDGTYVHAADAEVMQRMAKEPECFEFQHCAIEGVKLEVFESIASLFGLQEVDSPAVLDVVRPLMQFISSVPEYARNTKKLSEKSKALRSALLAARDPSHLVFNQIPEILGVSPSDGPAIGKHLSKLISEIRESYDGLLSRIGQSIQDAFATSTPLDELRNELSKRSKKLFDGLAEGDLRSFVNRIGDSSLAHRNWLESIANHLARKSAARWDDFDEEQFHSKLSYMAKRMMRAEAAQVEFSESRETLDSKRAVRVALTKPDGTEYTGLTHWSEGEEDKMRSLEEQILELIKSNGRVGVGAAVKALWAGIEGKK